MVPTVWLSHNLFFTHQSIDRVLLLFFFQFLSIMNKLAINIWIKLCVHMFSFLLDKYLGIELLGQMLSVKLYKELQD